MINIKWHTFELCRPLLQYTCAQSQRVDIIMVLLQVSFTQLQYVGLWQPHCWPNKSFKSRAYWLYTIYILVMVYCFAISEVISLFTMLDNIEDLSDNCFMLLTVCATCVKAIVVLFRRSEIIAIITKLEMYPHKPMNIDEERIQEEFDQRIRFFTLFYGGFIECSAWIMSISAFFQGIPFGVLPYKAWVPYDYSEPSMYWFTFCLELFITIIVANICIGTDTVLPGFYTLVCAQFNILKYRLEMTINGFGVMLKSGRMISESKRICEKQIIDCVQHHRAIFEISQQINSISSSIIFVQYLASSIIVGVSIFMLSQMPPLSFKFLFFGLYLGCLLFQIFLLCASGNEATIECQSLMISIYNTNWYKLPNHTKKYLGLIMIRTLRPIVFKSGHLIVLSLNSFTNLLKHAYTAYTVLHQQCLK